MIHNLLSASESHQGQNSPFDSRRLGGDAIGLFSTIEKSRWGGLPLMSGTGTADQLAGIAPVFRRLPMKLHDLGSNPHLDIIVTDVGKEPLPVACVSPSYRIIQHSEILKSTIDGIRRLGGDPEKIPVHAVVTPHWEKVRFEFDLGSLLSRSPDGENIALRLFAQNSVDGKSSFRLHFGWIREICTNGMAAGDLLTNVLLPHKNSAKLKVAFHEIKAGFDAAKTEADRMEKWANQRADPDKVAEWIDRSVARSWGTHTAARVLHICRTGHDATTKPPFVRATASKRRMQPSGAVPGSPPEAHTLYDVLQALSWVASRRSDLDGLLHAQKGIWPLFFLLCKAHQENPAKLP